jgi:hypothetical protein
MLRRAMAIATAAGALAAMPAVASANDVAATHAYVQASYALARAGVARIGAAQANVEALNRKLETECPRAGAGSPINAASVPMSYEVAAALWSVSYGTSAGPIGKFVRAVRPLHWSNARITRIARGYATSLHEMATLPLPDLCGDVRAFTASHFQVIPPHVTQLDQHAEAIELEPVPQRLLAPFERGADAGLAARTRGLERKVEEAEFVKGQDDLIKMTATLGLPE